MEKSKKLKLFIGLSYLTLIGLFLFYLFSKFSFQELTSYEFIKDNIDYFLELKKTNLFILTLSFLLFTILWVFPFLGFGAPVALLGGVILGKWFGVVTVVLGMSIGATFLYIFANYFLKEIVREKFLNRFKNLEEKFKKSEFLYLLIYRFVGGIPFAISNVLPCIFNVKSTNFFYATFLGMLPQLFVVSSIASGLEKVIDQNEAAPSIFDVIMNPEIYVPLVAFFSLIIITIIIRKFFYKN